MKRIFLCCVLLAVTLTGCVQFVVVEPKQRTTVQNVLTVEPQIAWNKANSTGTPNPQASESQMATEVWTVDGSLLHALSF